MARRRWLLYGTTQARLDRSPNEVGRVQVVLFDVLVKLWSWLSSDPGLQTYDEVVPALEAHGSRGTVQRWLHRFLVPRDWTGDQALAAAGLLKGAVDAVWAVHGDEMVVSLAAWRRERWQEVLSDDDPDPEEDDIPL